MIFRAIKELFKKSISIDFLVVTDELERQNLISSVGGLGYIQTLTSIVPSAASCQYYIDIVRTI